MKLLGELKDKVEKAENLLIPATQTRNTERAFSYREGSFAAQASFFNDMFCPKLFEKKTPLTDH